MINGIYPLFKNNEYDEANNYLAQNMLNTGYIKVLEMDQDLKEASNGNSDFLRSLIMDVCRAMYGKNSPQMANHLIVQNLVDEKLRPTLLNYMKYVGLDGYIVDFIPSQITSRVLFNKINKSDFKPLDRWNPNELWNFSEYIPPEKMVTSPLNGFIHMTLILKNINNRKFLLDLQKNGIVSSKNIKESNGHFKELEIQLLPYNNFNKVLNIASAIFKNY